MFDLLGDLVELVTDLFSDGGGDLLAGAADLALEIGTDIVAIGAGAAAIGAIVALAELTRDTIRKYLASKAVASQIEDILNNDENTLNKFVPEERLRGAHKYSISQMTKVVDKIEKTADGQSVATVRVVHPRSGVYLDAKIAGNHMSGVYEGLTL